MTFWAVSCLATILDIRCLSLTMTISGLAKVDACPDHEPGNHNGVYAHLSILRRQMRDQSNLKAIAAL